LIVLTNVDYGALPVSLFNYL